MRSAYYVRLGLPAGLPREARDRFSDLVVRVAGRFSFQGLEDWSVEAPGARVLGTESEFHDLTRSGPLSREMRAYFASVADARGFARLLRSVVGDVRVSPPRRQAPRDWMKLWRRHYKTQTLREGRRSLHIVPSWKERPRKGISVRISPGQAFGTGTHPTTRLCLRLLLRHLGPEARVLDFGAGTGILLIAALKCGAASGAAVESDATALEQCRKNARLNRVEGLRFLRSLPRGGYDLVFANVLAPVLLAHREKLLASLKPGGIIFLSGILKAEGRRFLTGFRAPGFGLEERLEEGDWVAFALRRRRVNRST